MNLDVGCGTAPKGDVNTDLFLTSYCVRKQNLKDENIANQVKSDIHHLPFRDKVFENCFCYHVIEHIGVRSVAAIKEMVRVTKNFLEIEVF